MALAGQTALAESVTLEPASKWQLNYALDSCRLVRVFGGPDHKTVFVIEQYEPSDTYTVQIAGPDFASRRFSQPSLRFGPNGGSVPAAQVIAASIGTFGAGRTSISIPLLAKLQRDPRLPPPRDRGEIQYPTDPEAAGAIIWFEMLEKGRVLGRLNLGSMREPVKALNACTEELLTHWGIDVAAHRTRKRGVVVIGTPDRWLTSSSYPADLLAKGTQGIVYFRLGVDEQGRVTSCHIQQSTRPAAFDEAVCRGISRKARFEPALDASGNPIKSYYRSTVRFAIIG
jgi:TonB family protein